MNWYKKAQQQYLWDDDPELDYINADSVQNKFELKYPKISNVMTSGLTIMNNIDNTESISASMNDYYIYDGVREFPMSDFEKSQPHSLSEYEKTKNLANNIKKSKTISPLIVVVGEDKSSYPYILEGFHRFDALQMLNIPTFPALMVLDKEDNNELV